MSREECAQRRGNCFRRTVAAMKPEAQPRPRQDSQQHKDALGRTTPHPKGDRADSVSPPEGCTGSPLTRARSTTGRNMPPPMRATMLAARRGAPSKAGRRIREPSFVTHRQRAASVADGTHSHNLRQQCSRRTHRALPSGGALTWPIRRCRFGGIEGRQATRGGDGPAGLSPGDKRSAQCRRREGSWMRIGRCRPHSKTPPPECQRRRQRDVRLQHRARPPPRPDFEVHRAQGGTAWARC